VCDHIIGLALAAFPQHGETDRLVKFSERIEPDDRFGFCPRCGASLAGRHDNELIKVYGRLAYEFAGSPQFIKRNDSD